MTIVLSPATRLPVLTALFEMRDEFSAMLTLRSQCTTGTIVSVIHQGLIGTADSYVLVGNNDEITLSVKDGELLHLTAHIEGAVVGGAIFEIDAHLADVGALLIPRTLSNLIVDQCQRRIVERGVATGLERSFCTDALPELDEAEQAVAL